ncbi:putative zinc finger, CCHC-type containing protein [Tanacetum coccineum]
MEDVKSRYDNTLIGYFVGKSLAFTIVQNYVNNTWAKFGLSKLMKMDNGVFLFKFDTKSGMDQVIERGPFSNTPLILNKWAPNISLKPNEKEVKMAIPVDEDDGSGYISEVIRVEYEWKPSSLFGIANMERHNSEKYPNKKNTVKRKRAVNIQLNNQIAGLQLHKPNLTVYRPVNKKGNDKQDKKKPADVKASSSHTSVQNDEGVQKPNSSTEEVVAECEKDSLRSKFKAAKVASKSNPRTTLDFEEESDEDEVYFLNEKYTSGMGGGFSLEYDDLEYYDGYEAQVFYMPGYDICLNSRHRK